MDEKKYQSSLTVTNILVSSHVPKRLSEFSVTIKTRNVEKISAHLELKVLFLDCGFSTIFLTCKVFFFVFLQINYFTLELSQ